MEHAVIVVSVVTGLVVVTTCMLVVTALRAVRRAYRSARDGIRSIRVTPVPAAATSPSWWTTQHRRHRMWRAVTSAEHAVGAARRADVPVGDLPALATRLRSAALGVDAVLRASAHGGPLRAEDRVACDQIETAAADIHRAALSSLRLAQVDTAPLLSAVQTEVAALAAGVRAATR